MVYCLNLNCQQPHNEDSNNICDSCGSNLLLRDRFCAIKVIGQGGFGKTYLASDSADGSLCVVKQFSYPSSSTALRLFAEEAQRLKFLGSHPQIPSFIDYVEQEKQYFIVQEYIEGNNLEEELATNGAFSEALVEQLLTDILPVIEFVHEGGVIHRDIKPENIIRRKSDSAERTLREHSLYLVDFGAAKRATETSLAKTGTTIGSAGYAAPEQTFGKAVIGSDLYSLGVTCVHLLTGLHPFDLIDSASGDWVWRDYLKEPVSNRLGQIFDKLLERGTRQRYQSAAEVLQDLQEAAEAYTIAARELSREVAELYKQAPVEELPVRRFHPGKIVIGLLVSGSFIAVTTVNVILNHQEQACKFLITEAALRSFNMAYEAGTTGATNFNVCSVFAIFTAIIALSIIGSLLWGIFDSQLRRSDIGKSFAPLGMILAGVVVMRFMAKLVLGG